jgi:ArsR family transcriptional regulator
VHEQILLLKTLADSTRLKLLKLLLTRELCVYELQALLTVSQPAVSQHLAKLKTAGLVTERKAGMWTYYRANQSHLQSGLGALSDFLEADLASITAMASEAERLTALNQVNLCCDSKGARES